MVGPETTRGTRLHGENVVNLDYNHINLLGEHRRNERVQVHKPPHFLLVSNFVLSRIPTRPKSSPQDGVEIDPVVLHIAAVVVAQVKDPGGRFGGSRGIGGQIGGVRGGGFRGASGQVNEFRGGGSRGGGSRGQASEFRGGGSRGASSRASDFRSGGSRGASSRASDFRSNRFVLSVGAVVGQIDDKNSTISELVAGFSSAL